MSRSDHQTPKQLRHRTGLLFGIHHYLYVTSGRPFRIEVQVSESGHFTAHAESTADPHESVDPQSGTTIDEVLSAITLKIDEKVSQW